METDNEDTNNNEEIVFENKYKVTKELFLEWSRENKTKLYFKIFWIICAILNGAIAIACITFDYVQYSIVFFIFVIYSFYRGILRNNFHTAKQYNALEKLYKKSNWERKITFYNDYIKTSDENISNVKFQYSDIIDIEKSSECIKIKMNNGGCIRIYKDAFTKSNLEECEDFLNKKMSFNNINK